MQDYEKLGVFYLGREYDLAAKKLNENLLLYDSRDLVTHAVAVGMTGSGKTGLCVSLIEEAAIDGVPSILIDPKGDLTNLLLTFPQLRGEDFLPWINAEDATRKGLSAADYASQQAALWQKGLAEWGQSPERMQRLRDAADFVIYTPGSSAGVPVSILKSFAAPPAEILEDGELFQERINTTVTSLLGLLNIEADPLQSREHILLATIIGKMWQEGHDLDLAALIAQIQTPPVTKIGVLDLESFYPSKDRFALVMALNNLLASPGFSAWLEGVPLDIADILHTPQGKPRVAVFSVAHLSDNERMFFVSMLLNQVLGWMRSQPGTTSLRALLYMDEIFGYFPPSANPPSKKPLLTLLKQARAFGLGVVLATQNPVDLDYKGLSNTGTWFIGRLQTERDKARVMEGLEGAAASAGGSFDRQKMEQLLAGLGNRVFLMNNTHEDEPVIFQTRWCLSYLRGPLTRDQIKRLMEPLRGAALLSAGSAARPASGAAPLTAASAAPAGAASTGARPTLPAEIPQFFLPLRGSSAQVVYRPMLIGGARVRFSDAKSGVDAARDVVALTPLLDQVVAVDWGQASELDFSLNDLEKSPAPGVAFGELPAAALKAKNFADWGRDFVTWLYGSQALNLLRSPSLKQVSAAGESERDFRVRLQQAAREIRDEQVDALRKKYAVKIAALQEKVRRAEQAVEREAEQANQAKMQTAISFGATLLGAFTGRKLASAANLNKAATAVKGVTRSMQQSGDVGRAKDTVESYRKQLEALNAQFAEESAALESRIDPATETLEQVSLKPKKTDIDAQLVALVWAPYRGETPAW
ncbi:MAG: ATP-binding protein [Anaerolineales bacterium]